MNRKTLFEFGDLDWFPQLFKDMMTDYLNFIIDLFKMHHPVIPILKEELQQSGSSRIIDLCSGGGGGMLKFSEALTEAAGKDIRITLTDKNPNITAMQHISQQSDGRIDYESTPVDAAAVPESLAGFRTIFNGFHHFSPEFGRNVLGDAVNNNSSIAIFEVLERKFANVVPSIILIPLFVLILTPFIRPFKITRILFTYLIPIIPVVIMWDGIVSALRSYEPEELKEIAGALGADKNYQWESGKIEAKGPNKVIYLMGTPGR